MGKEPEIKTLNSGQKVVNFSLATSESWKDKASGEQKVRTEWHNVVIFNENLAKIVEAYVHKSSKLYVEGSLQTRKWTDKSGSDRYTTEIVLSGFNGSMVLLNGKPSDAAPSRDSIDEPLPF